MPRYVSDSTDKAAITFRCSTIRSLSVEPAYASKTSAKGADQKEYGRACLRILMVEPLPVLTSRFREGKVRGVDPVGCTSPYSIERA